jgi:quercetin dioxygenase-like cupin family protein
MGKPNKAARDRARNNRIEDVYVNTAGQDWLPFYPGFVFKLLRVSAETGTWTVLVQAEKGASFPRHTHLGAGEYFMVSGRMEVRGGVENGGITATAGDYGYEPTGIVHDHTVFPVKTVFLFTNHGAVNFIDDEDRTVAILDWQEVMRLEAAGRKALKTAA